MSCLISIWPIHLDDKFDECIFLGFRDGEDLRKWFDQIIESTSENLSLQTPLFTRTRIDSLLLLAFPL